VKSSDSIITIAILTLLLVATNIKDIKSYLEFIKFKFKTSLKPETAIPSNPERDFLKNQMAKVLKEKEVTFDFMVQFQENADTMPVEDPTVKWTSPFVKVATITLLKQEFDTEEIMNFGDALSFNPWHSLPVHRPLGGLNRARYAIYGGLSDYRTKVNGRKIFEPTDMSFKLPQ